MSPSASIRRILAVARTTARDLGAGCGSVLLVLAVVSGLLASGEGAALDGEEAAALRALDRLQQLVAWSAIGVVVLCAWSVDRDRRRGRWAWWACSPLRAWEYALGKWIAGAGSCAAAVLVVGVLGSALAGESSSAWLEPVRRQSPDALHTASRSGEAAARSLAPVVLSETTSRVVFQFDTLPRSGAQTLEVQCEPWNFERRDDAGHTMVRALDGGGRLLAEVPLLDSRGPIRVELGEQPELPIFVRVKPGSFRRQEPLRPGGLRVRPDQVVLLGDPVPRWWTLTRLLGGAVLLVLVGSALAVACATAFADLIAATCALSVITLGFHRAFLLQVCWSIAREDSGASVGVRAVAGAMSSILEWAPEFAGWLELRARVAGVPVDGPLELPYGLAAGLVAGFLALAVVVLKLRRRGW